MLCLNESNLASPNISNCQYDIFTSLKGLFNIDVTYCAYYSGYFKAPMSGDYQFLAYGDDVVEFVFNGTTVINSPSYD